MTEKADVNLSAERSLGIETGKTKQNCTSYYEILVTY